MCGGRIAVSAPIMVTSRRETEARKRIEVYIRPHGRPGWQADLEDWRRRWFVP